MATDDQQVLVTGQAPAPATFRVPGNGQLRPKAVFASFDGSGAGGDFQPALKIISDAGEIVGVFPTSATVVAGASADVSWFPRVGGQTGGATATTLAFARSWNDQFSGDPVQTVLAGTTTTASFAHTETTDASVVSFSTTLHTNDTAHLDATGTYLLYCGSHWSIVDDGVTSLIQAVAGGNNAFPHLPLNPTTSPGTQDGVGSAQSQDFAVCRTSGGGVTERILLGNQLITDEDVNQCYFVILYLGTG